MRWKEKKKLIKIKKMNKEITPQKTQSFTENFFPHHTKDENPVKLCVLCGEPPHSNILKLR